jgi:hypothetical protein
MHLLKNRNYNSYAEMLRVYIQSHKPYVSMQLYKSSSPASTSSNSSASLKDSAANEAYPSLANDCREVYRLCLVNLALAHFHAETTASGSNIAAATIPEIAMRGYRI